MSRRWLFAFLLLALAQPLWAKESPLLARLKEEFQGKSFITKILLGSYLETYDPGCQRQVHRLVDTEVTQSGVNYLVRTGTAEGCNILLPSFHINESAISRTIRAGTPVWVWKVELKGDRVELWLSSSSGRATVGSYAKIKMMFGDNFQNTMNYDAMLAAIATALRIERLERLEALNTEHYDLQHELTAAEERYKNTQGTTAMRLNAAKRLREALQKLAQNRTTFCSLSPSCPEGWGADYARRAAALETEIPSLEQQAKREHVLEMKQALQADVPEIARLRSELQKRAPSTFAEWQQRSENLDKFRELLAHRQRLHAMLEANGEPASAAEKEQLQQDLRLAERVGEELEAVRLPLEYRAMERERAQLMDRYTRAFGTPQERPALQALLLHLQRMYENRLAAEKKGDATASQQAATLLREIEKLRRR